MSLKLLELDVRKVGSIEMGSNTFASFNWFPRDWNWVIQTGKLSKMDVIIGCFGRNPMPY